MLKQFDMSDTGITKMLLAIAISIALVFVLTCGVLIALKHCKKDSCFCKHSRNLFNKLRNMLLWNSTLRYVMMIFLNTAIAAFKTVAMGVTN